MRKFQCTIVFLVLLFCGVSHASEECSAEISESDFGGKGSIWAEWEIEVEGCARSQGTYDFTWVVRDESGKEYEIDTSKGWGFQDTSSSFETTDHNNVGSDEELVEVKDYEVTGCTCSE